MKARHLTLSFLLALPAGACDRAHGLGPQCPGQAETFTTVGDLRAFLASSEGQALADSAHVMVLIDGKAARLVSVVAPGCWRGSNSREYGIEHCNVGEQPDSLVLY